MAISLETRFYLRALICGLMLPVIAPLHAHAADRPACQNDAIIVFDSSGSMSQPTESGATRMDLARQAAHQVIPVAAQNRNLGLVVYGPGDKDRCQKLSLEVTPRANAAEEILAVIDKTETEGETPLSSAVEAAAVALDYTRKPAVIVLLTDGEENCGRFPCQVAHELKSKAHDLTIHVIAFRLHPRSFRALRCLSRENGGLLLPANTMEQLVEALSQTLTCSQTTAENFPIPAAAVTENTARSKFRLAQRFLCGETRADRRAQCPLP